MKMRCPHCGGIANWDNNPYRPFCSERCKLLDLGMWIDEKYRVPVMEASSDEEGDKKEREN